MKNREFQKGLKPVTEYDPYKWNRFPDVEPIEGVTMRTQFKFMGREYRLAGTYRKMYSQWEFNGLFSNDALGLREIENGSLTYFQFRLWDDYDAEENEKCSN